MWCPWRSTVFGVSRFVRGNFALVSVTDGEQHVFGEIQVAALFAVVFKDVCFNDGVHRTAFFAKATKNAFSQIDVVPGGSA
jgi:hypothetical protein